MKISTNLFCSALISQQKREKYLKKINKGKTIKNLLLLIYRPNNDNLLEIITTSELYRLNKREQDVYVVGIIESIDEAYEWISKLMADTYEHFEAINKNTVFKELACDA
jgi:hypothetical protein